ncbi:MULTISPECIES: glycosyl transferase [unclassified Micromonospora]|uniref:glycosyl transferase n=1 Tax=unclassified Micromonospora TaxID=2617518 RepID=UPI00188EB282|nr:MULTISPECIES: glycosyl transferase [unclassified Micromonospora]MBF5030925.1 glycosyl transferase [Micromonospora sp. ANENR4]MCZ7474293.1 glycosyl transferase [Micromonospora sp. WMMC273]WBC04945.1 glycosyl transferase [Micromonospora sp. WMMA1976]
MTNHTVPLPRSRGGKRPHAIYLAIGFPPAAKSSAYRLRETANQFVAQGWDITVITICQQAWEREYGLDHTLSEKVDPRVRVVELPLIREDLETDIRAFSEERSLDPAGWIKRLRKREQQAFPEPVFGGWRYELEKAVLRLHREHPADLLLASCAPYVNLAATRKLWEEHKVPYAVDFRDGWSLDVIGGGEAFTRDSVSGRWESTVLENALAVWCVNDPIAGFYRERYPHLADRVHVVRNGYDEDSLPDISGRSPDPAAGLTFGYLGSVNFSPAFLESVLDAWRIARRDDPLLARSRFEVRGHIGAGASREANRHMDLLKEAAVDGVSFGGPVPKAELAATYGSWDALVLMLVGGRFVTSGKVYEFMASGLPVLSAHDVDHDASNVLAGHPLWTGAVGLDPHRLAGSFVEAGRLALKATDADRAAARDLARRFARPAVLAPAVRRLTELVRPTGAGAATPATTSSTGDARL